MTQKSSFLAWLDHSEEDQRRMRELLKFFESRDTVDDLGIGTVRDLISNELFPGTSTIQTRAKYFLFIPWIFAIAERRFPTQLVAKALDMERKLIAPLKASGDTDGLIGIDAGVNVRTLPSSIFWSGLSTYRIFTAPSLTINQYGRAIGQRRRSADFEDELADRHETFWHREIPPAPEDFERFKTATFALSGSEAEWLCNRITDAPVALSDRSLLGVLVDESRVNGWKGDGDSPWEASIPDAAAPQVKALLNHAQQFSCAIEGATLFYNFMLAESRLRLSLEETDATDPAGYADRLEKWHSKAQGSGLLEWAESIDDFWDSLPGGGARVYPATRIFVNHLAQSLAECGLEITESDAAKTLIQEREKDHKKGQARFHNKARLAVWAGEAGTAPLTYRWPQVKRMLGDISSGLEKLSSE